jgi:hypothetical protein
MPIEFVMAFGHAALCGHTFIHASATVEIGLEPEQGGDRCPQAPSGSD